MYKSAKSRAEEQFAATQKKTKRALREKEKGRQERAEQTARLRALRLAKEAADKEAAEETDSKAPSPVEDEHSGLEHQVANDPGDERDPLKIPQYLRRQGN